MTPPGEDDPDPRDLLAHDIRAAVTDVIGGLRLIELEELPETVRDQVGRVHASSEWLARLTEELLGSAPDRTTPSNLNLTRFLQDELRRWHGAAQPNGAEVVLDRHPSTPEIVRLDGLHLRRIIANLMGNALRHVGDGRVVLGAQLYQNDTLSFCISDNGPGFAPELLSTLFDPATADGPHRGTGMGLHIAAAHAKALGGTIRAENLAPGARVTLTIPPDRWRGTPEKAGTDLPDLSGFRILVADDSPTVQTLVQAMLTRMGAECEIARDGIETLNWLARERFDLALIDIEMPVLSGLEVMRSERLRQARGIAPPMSMIALTAHVLRDNDKAIQDAGADAILTKPLASVERFGQAIAQYLEAAPDASSWAPEAAPPLSAATLSELMRAAGPESEIELLERLRSDLRAVSERLAAALVHPDPEAVRAETHILLSLASAVGALPTQEAARRLNALARSGDGEAIRISGKVCLGRLTQLRAELGLAAGGRARPSR
ncbi:MAG: ATP-binding protein [Pseudomonadota bacterium]